MAFVEEPLHNDWLTGCTTSGVGLTVMVKYLVMPLHPLMEGMMVTVPVIGALLLFTAVKTGILPVPLAPRPIRGWSFVQVYTTDAEALLKLIASEAAPLHNSWLEG